MAQFLKNSKILMNDILTFNLSRTCNIFFLSTKSNKIKIENVAKIASKLDLVKILVWFNMEFVRFLFIWKLKSTPDFVYYII